MRQTDHLRPGNQAIDTGLMQVGQYPVLAYHKPFAGEGGSGDRLLVRALPSGDLLFLVADAAGHGDAGDVIWRACAEPFEAIWDTLASNASLSGIEEFARSLNAVIGDLEDVDQMPSMPHLALSVGVLTPTGHLDFATFGYGVHVLAATTTGLWWTKEEQLFGLKLGWLPDEAWARTDRAFVAHSLQGVKRIVVLTDGFLGDDFKNVNATLQDVRALGEACALQGSVLEAAGHIRARGADDDDATLVIIDLDTMDLR